MDFAQARRGHPRSEHRARTNTNSATRRRRSTAFSGASIATGMSRRARRCCFGDDAARKANTLAVIDFVLSHTLRLFHPFLPFITEELWHGMGYATDMPENQGGKTIMFAPWPKPLDDDFKGHYGLDDCDLEIDGARNTNSSRKAATCAAPATFRPNKKVKFVFKPAGTSHAARRRSHQVAAQRRGVGSERKLSAGQRHADGARRTRRIVSAARRLD